MNLKLLIFDELINGLDLFGIYEMCDFICVLVRNEGISVFVFFYLLSEIEFLCDWVVIMIDGMIIKID